MNFYERLTLSLSSAKTVYFYISEKKDVIRKTRYDTVL